MTLFPVRCPNFSSYDKSSDTAQLPYFRSNLWVNTIKKHGFNINCSNVEILQSKLICDNHFDESCFTNTKRNRLLNYAVPTNILSNMTVYELPPGKKLNQCSNEKDNSNQEIQTECNQSSNSIMISPLINGDNVNHENDLCQPISASTDYFNMEVFKIFVLFQLFMIQSCLCWI